MERGPPHARWRGRDVWFCCPSPPQLFTDGITNKLVACYTDEDMVDAVLVRIYGRKTELFVDRETELRNFQVLRAHGCAPDLYCAFQNGLCYQFLPGIALGPDHVRDPHIFRCAGAPWPRERRSEAEPWDGGTGASLGTRGLLRVPSSAPRCPGSRAVLQHHWCAHPWVVLGCKQSKLHLGLSPRF